MFNVTSGLGARKKSRKKSTGTCRIGTVKFKTKRGKVIAFRGKSGPGCGPRPKPSTRHLAPYKQIFGRVSKACKGAVGKDFRSCVAAGMRKVIKTKTFAPGRRARRR